MTAALGVMMPATVKVAMKVRVKAMMKAEITAEMTAKEGNKNKIRQIERKEGCLQLSVA